MSLTFSLRRATASALAVFGALSVTAVIAQTPVPAPTPGQKPAETPGTGQTKVPDAKPPVKPGTPKPYKDVVTAEAKTDLGVFSVHRIDDKLLFEIPVSLLGRDMLWSTELAELPTGFGYGGTHVNDKVVRWTRRNNKIFLRTVDYTLRSETDGAIRRAVEASSMEPIVMAFDVEAEGQGKAPVIDVTKLYTTDPGEFSVKSAVSGSGVDASRSYVDRVKSFDTNVETRSVLTFNVSPAPSANPFVRGRRAPGMSSATVLVHYSLVLLPEKPMMGRFRDSRVGFFSERFEEYGTPENRVLDRQFIARYRLEKKDPSAALSDPVKSIIYYVSREVPEIWKPYVKKGVEMWKEAFEQAGFRDAIKCEYAPSRKDDPNWDPEDARYSVIRWAPSTVENAMGPHVHDPRSGEIISAHIIMWHNVLKLGQAWYFVQASPNDPKSQKLPFAEPLMGEILQYIVAHEVGHTLGLEHNFKASSTYTINQLRNKAFTEKYGTEASIMDYGRFNYVAQPGDGARLIPIIGPYDRFAIEWGYAPIPSASTPGNEKSILDRIASRQVTDPMVRFGNSRFDDPSMQTEDLGSDPIAATAMGLLNISRVAKYIVSATTKPGEDYSLLQETYAQLVGQRARELGHVSRLVGGSVETDYHAGRGGDVFAPVPKAKQAEAVAFLIANGLYPPKDLLDPSILNKIQSSGVVDSVIGSQRGIIANLLADDRIKRLLDNQAMNGNRAYSVTELVLDLQQGVWSELDFPVPAVGLYRRHLQRAYLEIMKGKLNGDAATQTDLRPIAIGALKDLAKKIDRSVTGAVDPITRLHLRDCRKTIERILEPKLF